MKKAMSSLLSLFMLMLMLISLSSFINAQQEYSGNSVLSCSNTDDSGPSPAFLYTCNGRYPSCQAFLIFKSEPPYNSVPAISMLMSTRQGELARINNVTKHYVFPIGKEVLVPVNCSCSGQYYQANTTFHILDDQQTYFIIGNNTYQGLSTCDGLKRANSYSEFSLSAGLELHVPLRCACPTMSQAENGTRHLLTYSVYWGDNFTNIGERFNVSAKSIMDANQFISEDNPTIFPFTTILIPLKTEPLSSQTKIHTTQPTLDPPPLPSSDSGSSRSKRRIYLASGIAAGCLFLGLTVIFSTVFLLYKKRTRRIRPSGREGKTKSVLPEDLLVEIAGVHNVLKVFEFKKLKKATRNFSSSSRIKGCMFRAEVGREIVAVKKMKVDVSEEVNILTKLNHFNLIKLHGVCNNGSCFYLVFEYMENGSLREWLHRESSNHSQSWSKKIQIALDVANGLHYLHSFTKPAYVHKHIKSSNILLTKNLRAKIANFSLARTAVNGAKTNTTPNMAVVGTRGYMAPEYVKAGPMTPKVDVYAFGVVMLELITGKDAVIIIQGEGEVLLSAAMISIMRGGNAEIELGSFLDPCFLRGNGIESVMRMAKLSVACLTKDPARRPSMGEVVSTLLKIQVDLQKSEMQFDEFA